MLRDRKTQRQGEYELVLLEELVPQDHFLRKVDAAVDFSFIHDMCKDLYCLDNGRPAIEPELLFKMLLLGYSYLIPYIPEDQLDYKDWFCGHWHIDKRIDKMHFMMRSVEAL